MEMHTSPPQSSYSFQKLTVCQHVSYRYLLFPRNDLRNSDCEWHDETFKDQMLDGYNYADVKLFSCHGTIRKLGISKYWGQSSTVHTPFFGNTYLKIDSKIFLQIYML